MYGFLHFVGHDQRIHDIQGNRAGFIAEQQGQEDLHAVVQGLVQAHVAFSTRPYALTRRCLDKACLLAVEALPFRLRHSCWRHAAMSVAQRMRQMLVRVLPFRVDQLDDRVVLEFIVHATIEIFT